MTTLNTTWLALVLQADPNHVRKSQDPVEYEFNAPGGPRPGFDYQQDLYKDGQRIFRGFYQSRGPYAKANVDGVPAAYVEAPSGAVVLSPSRATVFMA